MAGGAKNHKEFANTLSQAENLILTDIYAAREQDPGDISGHWKYCALPGHLDGSCHLFFCRYVLNQTFENLILTDIYAAREQDPGDISSRTLQDELKKLGKNSYYFSNFAEIEEFLHN